MAGLLQQHWMVSTLAATGCWALSDVCCDCCIATTTTTQQQQGDDDVDDDDFEEEEEEEEEDPEKAKALAGTADEKGSVLLTPEQNAMISAWVSGVASLSLAAALGTEATDGSRREAGIAVFAGAVHFVAYAVELRAYRTASSTVITPLLQLSAVWMTLLRATMPLLASALPHPPTDAVARAGVKVSLGVPPRTSQRRRRVVADLDADLDALYVATAAMRPEHLAAVFFVFVGGFLPAARGKVSRFADTAFYKQEAVQCCLVGELLVCVYNALLHACTFRQALRGGSSRQQVDASRADVLRFFLISRLGTFAAMLLGSGSFAGFSRRDFRDIFRRCDRFYLAVAVAGEVLSVFGVCIVMFSYASFHEPAVVNAAEGGVQQLLNLCFAIALRYVGFGRRVHDRRTKLLSFALVSAGLALSCR